jgi:hypothetical protein
LFRVVNGVEPPAVLDPPQMAAAFLGVEFSIPRNPRDVLQGKAGRNKRDGAADVFGVEVQPRRFDRPTPWSLRTPTC